MRLIPKTNNNDLVGLVVVAVADEGFLGWGDGGLVGFALELFLEVCMGCGYEARGHEEIDGG